jgi:hypothetical protein
MVSSSEYKRRIECVFGLKEETAVMRDDDSLGHLGFPSLSSVEIFLTAPGSDLWKQEQRIEWPQTCCSCGRAAEVARDVEDKGGLWRRKTAIKSVPHCRPHAGGGEARLVVIVEQWTAAVTRILLTGEDLGFLRETLRLNQTGDAFPPWVAFPEYDSLTMAWREGEGQHWLDKVWRPFWDRLTAAERDDYLNRWNAPAEWRERLSLGY